MAKRIDVTDLDIYYGSFKAVAQIDPERGVYSVVADPFKQPGSYPIQIVVSAGSDTDLLGADLVVADAHAGKRAKCPACKNPVTVPAVPVPSPEPDPPPAPTQPDDEDEENTVSSGGVGGGGGRRQSTDLGQRKAGPVAEDVVKRMTGAQIKELLEHQFANMERPKVLFPSHHLRYTVDLQKEFGQRISQIRIAEQSLNMTGLYHVTVNSFLASGGDGFYQLNLAPTVSGGELDIDALSEYLRKNPGVMPPDTNRIQVL